MAIAAEQSSPSGPPLAADWAALSIAAASETRVPATAIVASATIAVAIAITNDDDHRCDGHDVDDRLHDGYEDVIADDGPPRCCFCPTTTRETHSRPGTLLQMLMHISGVATSPRTITGRNS